MKKFLYRLGLFALIPLLFSTGITFILESRYYRPYLKVVPQGTRAILLGDSHAGALENNLADHGIFNFSHASDSYHDMLRKLRHTIKVAPHLRLVIITADDHTLSAYRERMNNADRSIFYLTPGEPDPLIRNGGIL